MKKDVMCDTVDLYNGRKMIVCTTVDERALVDGARQLGFIFSVRTPQFVTVSTVNASHVIQFSSFLFVELKCLLPGSGCIVVLWFG